MLVALGLGACGDEGDFQRPRSGSAGPSVEVLDWCAPEGPAVEDDSPATVAHLKVSAPLDPTWDVDSDRYRVESVTIAGESEPLPVLRLELDEEKRWQQVRIPLPDSSEPFNRVRVLSQQDRSLHIGASVELEDGSHLHAPTQAILGSPGVVSLEFDFARLRTRPQRPVAVHVNFPWNHTQPGLAGVVLEQVPMPSFLPPVERPDVVELEHEARRAVGLAEGRPLVTRFRAEAGALLEFGAGVPTPLSGTRTQVRIELRSLPEGELLERTRFDVAWDVWSPWRIPLDAFAGRELELRVELLDDHPTQSVCALCPPLLLRPRERPRRVLLVTSDTHRADHLGLAPGAVEVRTPGLDAFARRGALFRDARSATNITNPSHGALLTGLGLAETGIVDNLTSLDDRARTLAEAFGEQGYLTLSASSAFHLRPSVSGFGQGFRRVVFTPRTEERGATTLERLRELLAAYPGLDVFVWLHVFDVHGPYTPDEADVRAYYGDGDPEAPVEPAPPEAARVPWAPRVRDPRWLRDAYRAEVTALDRWLGPFLADPTLADAWVAFTADHGEALGEHHIWWEHQELYPPTLDVPLVLVGPGVPSGVVLEHPVTNTDVGRTLLDLAGHASVPFPGRNLLVPPAPDAPRFALSSHGLSASVQVGDAYLVLHLERHARHGGGIFHRHAVELYDLRVDPDCAVDRAAAEPGRVRELRPLLTAWLAAGGPGLGGGDRAHDPEALEALRALGYASEVRTERGALWGAAEDACACERCAELR